jgi:hypothetical protein
MSEKVKYVEEWIEIFTDYMMRVLREIRVNSSTDLRCPMDISYYVKVK